MPGKIIQGLKIVKTKDPVFMIDEIDKMSMDFRGDPSSALLEVLDPEQNSAFNDHYLEVDFDLSDVMFICTANSLNIPPALLDRMETVEFSGYTVNEKKIIAANHLIPAQISENGLLECKPVFTDKALEKIITDYTLEAGIRGQVDERNEKMGYKIREAQLKKIPYMLVVGKKEAEDGTVAVRVRGAGDIGAMPLAEFVDRASAQVRSRALELS